MMRCLWLAALLAASSCVQAAEQPQQPGIGEAPPTIGLKDRGGNVIDLAALQGKVVVVTFWASWCGPCRRELPMLGKVQEVVGREHLEVIAVNFKEPPRTVGRFVAAQQWRVPVVLDTSGAVAQAWGVKVFPTTFLVDPQGRARQVIRGEVDWSDATALGWVERLLAA